MEKPCTLSHDQISGLSRCSEVLIGILEQISSQKNRSNHVVQSNMEQNDVQGEHKRKPSPQKTFANKKHAPFNAISAPDTINAEPADEKIVKSQSSSVKYENCFLKYVSRTASG
jgi:hypothetical protein